MSFFEIFQPGLRYLREEKDRQRMLVVKPTPGAGPPLGIDLDAGTATFAARPTPAGPTPADTATADRPDSSTEPVDPPSQEPPGQEPPGQEPTGPA